MNTENFRTEHDLIGDLEVPADALYGIQTQRSIENFPLKGEKPLSAYPELIIAMLQVKKAAALANIKAGDLDGDLGKALINTIDELLADYPDDQFPVHSFHGGGAISTNMNVNEVVANSTNRLSFQKALGSYSPIHPNDHVNLNQSTNDVVATACHLAILKKWEGLEKALDELSREFDRQGKKWQDVLKISRTCLQDAVEISFKEFFSGYSAFTDRNIERLRGAASGLCHVNLGGNIIGRRGDTSDAYFDTVIESLQTVMGTKRFQRNPNLFDGSQNIDDMTHVASQLDILARGLVKIAKDFRLMSSGPMTGFGEITLPGVQPGSSAMPGKINPSVPEFLIQCCFQAVGRCCSARMALDHGELDLNVWESVVIINVLDAMACLENGIRIFTTLCLAGIQVNLAINEKNINTIIPLLIRLKKEKGYAYTSRVYKETKGDPDKIRQHLSNKGD